MSVEYETARESALAYGDGVKRWSLTTRGCAEICVAPSRVLDVNDELALREIVATVTGCVPAEKAVVGWANYRLLETEENNPGLHSPLSKTDSTTEVRLRDLPPSRKIVYNPLVQAERTLPESEIADETWLPVSIVQDALTRLRKAEIVDRKHNSSEP